MNSEVDTCNIEVKINCIILQQGLKCDDIHPEENIYCLVEVIYIFNVSNTFRLGILTASFSLTYNSDAVPSISGQHGPT